MKENLSIIPENLEISSIGKKDNVIPGDGGDCVNNHGIHGEIPVLPKAISDQDIALKSSEISLCQEFSQSISLDAKVQKCFNKCSTFPASKEMHENSLSTDGRADSPNAVTQGQKLVSTGTSAYSRSISLPSSSTLVSAMKGGRALNGTIVKLDCHVKWAPEVYEPPATSMPHTVKTHPQRPYKKKAKRKYKGKSSRGNGNERKHGNQKNSSTTSKLANVWVRPNDDMILRDEFSKSKAAADVLEYNFNGQETKCGSSFLREGQPNAHFPVGEAV